jgi:hypothetical protein
MRDAPTLKPPSIPSYIKHNLPGTIFDGNRQCQYSLGTLAGRQCVKVSNPVTAEMSEPSILFVKQRQSEKHLKKLNLKHW